VRLTEIEQANRLSSTIENTHTRANFFIFPPINTLDYTIPSAFTVKLCPNIKEHNAD
jgi:hypothetical protein